MSMIWTCITHKGEQFVGVGGGQQRVLLLLVRAFCSLNLATCCTVRFITNSHEACIRAALPSPSAYSTPHPSQWLSPLLTPFNYTKLHRESYEAEVVNYF